MASDNKPSPGSADDNRTRLKSDDKKASTKKPSGTDKNLAALTRIKNTLGSRDNSEGFANARNTANKALAENKIVLNKRFVLETVIGNGGMGTVYKARDLRKIEADDLNPYIAVKVLNSDFEHHPDAFVSLQREASRSHTLAHPNIVTVHDFDRDGSVIFMTMELLDGQGLDHYLSKDGASGMEKNAALKIIADCCSALNYAHKHDIIHSDLKPGNIYLTQSGAKVLDFGIARIGSGSKNEKDFDAGQLGALTPAYASLEMLQNLPPDPSDDVYALAIICYELLTGQHPYERQAADVALEKRLRPKRIKTLSNKQWKALSNALLLERKDRTGTVQQFSDELLTKKNIKIYLVSGLIVLIAVAGITYTTLFAPNELSLVIEETLSNANACYNKKEYTCAVEGAEAILKISPGHSEAKNLLATAKAARNQQKINSTLAEANACLKNNDIDCAKRQHELLRKIQPDKIALSILTHDIETKQISLTVTQKLNETMACFNKQDWQCVIDSAEKIKSLQSDNTVADTFIKQANMALSKEKAQAEKIEQKYKRNISRAEKCFKQQDYACAVKFSKQSLNLKPDSSRAESLFQKSIYAQQQQAESRKKADIMLKKGTACFERKNYSCAIAKSESALEIVPNHTAALKLKTDAKKAIADLKRSMVIE